MGKNKTIKKLSNTMMKIDLFGETASFHISGQDSYASLCGFFLSLGIFVTVLAYAGNKWMIMLEHEDTNHQKTVLKDDIDVSEVFDYDKLHFNIAVGLINP